MVNFKGGKAHKKQKNNPVSNASRELLFRNEDQDYATVITILGGSRVKVKCFSDSTERIAKICGTMKKRVWISKEDVVLVSLREFEDTCDVIHKYTPDEVRMLASYGEISSTSTKEQQECECGILFDENADEIDIDGI